jgi:hypothetical protein
VPAPPELAQLQGFLAGALRRAQPIAEDEAIAAAAAEHVAGSDRLSPAAQADLYREQFWLRHEGSLAEDYVGLAALVGEEVFHGFLHAFLDACPPRHFSLRDLGEGIVPFAEGWGGFPPAAREAALAMLRYESAIVAIFDAAEPEPLDPGKLGAMGEDDWDRARLVLSPLLHLFALRWPLHTFRIDAKAAAEAGEAPPPFPEPREVHLAMFRHDLVVSYEELAPEAFALLGALAAGEPLPRACDRLAEGLDQAAAAALGEQVGPWFQQWTTARWIVDVEPLP